MPPRNPDPPRRPDRPPETDFEASLLPPAGGGPVDCRQIQGVLFVYLARELGDGQSRLVHEHLRHCAACSGEAAAMQRTLDLLHAQDPARHVPAQLSAGRHRRLLRALMHPLVDWAIEHHWLVALLASLATLALACWLLSQVGSGDPGTPVWIRVWRGVP